MKLTIGSSEGETSRLGHHVVSHLSPVCAIDFALQDRLAVDFALQLPLPLRQVLQQTRTKLCRLLLDPFRHRSYSAAEPGVAADVAADMAADMWQRYECEHSYIAI